MNIADEIEELAFRIEADARRHECMGADCATCHPNGVGSQLRGLSRRIRDLEAVLAGHRASMDGAIAELNAKNDQIATLRPPREPLIVQVPTLLSRVRSQRS